MALAAYRALRVEGLARIDLFLQEDDEIVVNEVNTMPGFTPISMFPMLWEAEGLAFGAVIEELIMLARSRYTPAPHPADAPGPLRFPGGHGWRKSATIEAGPVGAARTPSVPCGVWS